MKLKTLFTLLPVLLGAVGVQAVSMVIDGFPDAADIPKAGEKTCRPVLERQLDVDQDGLLDLVSVQLRLDSSQPLKNNLVEEKAVLKICVEQIDYALASGTCGTGRPLQFSYIELAERRGIKVNGKKYENPNTCHLIGIKADVLKIQCIDPAPLKISSVGIEIEIDPEHPELSQKQDGSALLAVNCLIPLVILSLRRGRK